MYGNVRSSIANKTRFTWGYSLLIEEELLKIRDMHIK